MNYGSGGAGGTVLSGSCAVTAGTKTVTVGGASTPNGYGNNSVFDIFYATGGTAPANSSITGGSNANYVGGTGSGGSFPGGGGAGGGANGSIVNGGNGYLSSISGTSTYYAGGGSSYNAITTGTAGLGGGGTFNCSSPGSGVANTGGGGGGACSSAVASIGGSGVVIIRYPNTYADAVSVTGAYTFTNTGGYKIYSWTGSGSITF